MLKTFRQLFSAVLFSSLLSVFPGAHLAFGQTAAGEASRDETVTRVIYLVRHAEKETGDPGERDPVLTEKGRRRAEALARVLRDAKIERVYSTDYQRTRQTAAPVAERLGLPVELYDPRDLEGFASTLRTGPASVLVVGHSNTTPELVTQLGGEPGSDIRESHEYDRLYVLVLRGDETTTLLQRYGECQPCEEAY